MAVSDDRKFTRAQVYHLLEGVKGKTLGEVEGYRLLIGTFSNDIQNRILKLPTQKTNHMDNLLYDQTYSLLNHTETNVLNVASCCQRTLNIRARYRHLFSDYLLTLLCLTSFFLPCFFVQKSEIFLEKTNLLSYFRSRL